MVPDPDIVRVETVTDREDLDVVVVDILGVTVVLGVFVVVVEDVTNIGGVDLLL